MAKRPGSIETIDLTRAGPKGGSAPQKGDRQRAVLDAAAAIAARGEVPTARAVCTELHDAGGVDYQRNYSVIKTLKESGRWPYDKPKVSPDTREPVGEHEAEEDPGPPEPTVAEELAAMERCATALEGLSDRSRVRVWRWLEGRIGQPRGTP